MKCKAERIEGQRPIPLILPFCNSLQGGRMINNVILHKSIRRVARRMEKSRLARCLAGSKNLFFRESERLFQVHQINQIQKELALIGLIGRKTQHEHMPAIVSNMGDVAAQRGHNKLHHG